jgi:hypothetical protein
MLTDKTHDDGLNIGARQTKLAPVTASVTQSWNK